MDLVPSFLEAYIERCDKETETVLAEERADFLDQPIEYFKQHKNEFIYVQSDLFEAIGVDAVSFEADDVFGNYDVMLGLMLQKKYQPMIKEYLHNNLNGDGAKFDLIFDADEGIWNLNFPLNYLKDFREEMTTKEAYSAVFQFLSKLVEIVKPK